MPASNAFAENGAKAAFSSVENGMELMDYLSEHSRFKGHAWSMDGRRSL
jgi:hypothetical protein